MSILEAVQTVARSTIGREVTPTDIRLYSVLHRANRSFNIAKNELFDDEMIMTLRELDQQGHIRYDEANNDIVIKESFYPYMIWMIEQSPVRDN
jgi:hypothetical protein